MKRSLNITLKVVVILAVLIAAALLVRDSSDRFRRAAYDASAPTASKVMQAAQWLPEDAELLVIVDPQRLFAQPGLRAKMISRLDAVKQVLGVDPSMLMPSLTGANAVGLVAAALTLGLPGRPASGVFVVQGKLDEATLVADVSGRLAADGEQLDRQTIGKITVYAERASDEAFAFAFPDSTHMIVGQRGEVAALVNPDDTARAVSAGEWLGDDQSVPLLGELTISDRLRVLLPPQIRWVTGARFSADAALTATLVIPVDNPAHLNDLTLFLEGLRVSYLLGGDGKGALISLLEDIRIRPEGDHVAVSIPLGKLL